MISKAKSCVGGTALFNYVIDNKKGYELLRNGLSGIKPKELYNDMSIIQQQNLRCKNNTISIVLSPTIKDSQKLSNDEFKVLVKDFFKEMQLDPKTAQYIAFVHTEKAHIHTHILLNRVQTDGNLINDSFISKRAQYAAHKVAIKHKLTSAKSLQKANELKNQKSHKAIKDYIKKAHYLVLRESPKNLKAYQAHMKKLKIQVLPTINKQGQIQGFRFLHEPTGINLKASEVDRNLKLHKLFVNRSAFTKAQGQLEISSQNYKTKSIEIAHSFALEYFEVDENHDEFLKKKRRRNNSLSL